MAIRRPAPIPPAQINDYEYEEYPKHIYIEPRVKHQKPVAVAKNAADETAIRERYGLDENGYPKDGAAKWSDAPIDSRPQRSEPVRAAVDPAQRMKDLEAELAKLRADGPSPASTQTTFTAAPVPPEAPPPWPVKGKK